jgi:5-methyltetrahydrofolate--homocysteine methyltransferase
MEAIAEQLARARAGGLLLVAQPNAGLPQLVGDRFVYDASPDELADHARALRDLGVDLVGACCGSTPGHIAAMSRALSTR